MEIRFDSRAEKYLFYFVIVYSLFLSALGVLYNLVTGVGVLKHLVAMSLFFLTVIPLIVVYKLPWEKRDLGFTPKETKIALVFLGILILLDTIDFLSYPAIASLFVIFNNSLCISHSLHISLAAFYALYRGNSPGCFGYRDI